MRLIMDLIIAYGCLPLLAYLIGSVPFGLVLAKAFSDIDVRKGGSGNIGATNVRRLAGNTLGIATLIADVSKGALPVLLAVRLSQSGDDSWQIFSPMLTYWGAFLGHLYPIYTKFRGGGKGVATAGGALFVISAGAGLISVSFFLGLLLLTRRVSAASLGAAAIMPLSVWYTTQSTLTAMGLLAVTGLIWVRHKENIDRLLKGSEPKLW